MDLRTMNVNSSQVCTQAGREFVSVHRLGDEAIGAGGAENRALRRVLRSAHHQDSGLPGVPMPANGPDRITGIPGGHQDGEQHQGAGRFLLQGLQGLFRVGRRLDP